MLSPASTSTTRSEPIGARPRFTWLGWFVLIEAFLLTATLLMPVWQPKPLGAVLALGLVLALAVAIWKTPRSLTGVRGTWILPNSPHAGDEVTVGASLVAPLGSPPVALEAWQPLQRRFDIMARLTGLDELPTRPSWVTRFPKRGLNRLPPLTIRTSQPFGLVSASLQISHDAEIIVLPAIGRIRRDLKTRINKWIEAQSLTPDPGDDELARLRNYRPGDHPHRIHWKASARHRSLLVTERHAAGCRRLALVIDTTTGADARKLERLIAVAATLVDYFCSEGWNVALYGHFAPHGVEGTKLRLLETLALAGAENGSLTDLIPNHRATIVLSLKTIDVSSFSPKPLLLTLAECDSLVWLPRRVR